MPPAALHVGAPIKNYINILSEYSKRGMGDQKDVLSALAGITRRFSSNMGCQFLEGLPTASFDLFLLFRRGTVPLRRREGFPSYSWVGWQGPIFFQNTLLNQVSDSGVNDWLYLSTWIIWYKRSHTGAVDLLWDPSSVENPPFQYSKFSGYRKRRGGFLPRTPLPCTTSRTSPTEDLETAFPFPRYQILQFWTLAVRYSIKVTDNSRGLCLILDRFETPCGALCLDRFEECTLLDSPRPIELILLSTISLLEWQYDHGWGSVLEAAGVSHSYKWRHYNVLILEWMNGVAERRGIGSVTQSSIMKGFAPGPVWREILLR